MRGGGIGMTDGLAHGCGGLPLVVARDWYTTALVGSRVGSPRTARQWLAALDMAVNRQGPEGGPGQGLSWVSDHGCQPTSTAGMRACGRLGSQHALTSATNPTGQADTERATRPRQAAGLGLQEWPCPVPCAHVLPTWIDADHAQDWPSSLGDNPPKPSARADDRSPGTPVPAA
jgi:putative transposase